jgi:formiminotetrahydrofolate cyclodeaminase
MLTYRARIRDFLRDLSSADGLPGSGAAGAVALGLAAACAAKASAITLKYTPENLELKQAHTALMRAIDKALEGSDEDAIEFSNFLQEGTKEAAERVLAADEELLDLVDALLDVLDRIESQVRTNVAPDITAARALIDAARAIHAANVSEMREQMASASAPRT